MGIKLKKIKDQVVVITGASSGIGLTTAEMAAQRGAAVLLSSRNEEDLRAAVDRIRSRGGKASYFVADVSDAEAMKRLAARAVEEFGGIDTWVNNAAVAVFGKLEETPVEDKRRLFDVNFWGVINGCSAALPHMKRRGGAVINIGSILSDLTVPLQGIYSASKHAVKSYTEALRMELESEGTPISVTLVKPAAIDTMYDEHARSHMAEEPKLPPPVYAPEVVARAILTCAEKPVPEVTVGGGGRVQTLMHSVAPRLSEIFMEKAMMNAQKRDQPSHGSDNLYQPSEDGRRQGERPRGYVFKSSAYTTAVLSDTARALPLLAVGAGLVGLVAWRGSR